MTKRTGTPAPPSVEAVQRVMEGATVIKMEEHRAAKAASEAETPKPEDYGDVPPQEGVEGEDPRDEVPDVPCPIVPLGHSANRFHYLNPAREIVTMKPADHTTNGISALFLGNMGWLWQEFPTVNADSKKTGWNAKKAGERLMRDCGDAGLFDPRVDRRGPGVWRTEDSEVRGGKGGPLGDAPLIVHAGDAIWLGGYDEDNKPIWSPPGRYGRHVFVGSRPEDRPGNTPATPKDLEKMLEVLRSWAWLRPDSDPVLLVGWLFCAMVVGALDWRPSIWITGGSGTGKTSLDKLVRRLLGASALAMAEATAASVYQSLSGSARPVLLDEFEAEETNYKSEAVIKLARLSSTRNGGALGRGGKDGESTMIQLDACFSFSSILIPEMKAADRSRITVLNLGPLPAHSAKPEKELEKLGRLGPALRRRAILAWPRFLGCLEDFRMALSGKGHTARAVDQLGTLLAAAWVFCSDEERPTADEVSDWCDPYDPDELAARTDDVPDHQRCLDHLLTQQDHAAWSGGGRRMVSELVRQAMNLDPDVAEEASAYSATERAKTRDRDLGRLGLRVVAEEGITWLAVANAHQGTAKLFEGTHWAARPGTAGVWRQSLLRVPGAKARTEPLRIGGVPSRVVLIPQAALSLEDEARTPPAPP